MAEVKNERLTEIAIHPKVRLCIRAAIHKERRRVDVRVYVRAVGDNGDTEWRPTKRGISIYEEHLQQVLAGIKLAAQSFDEDGDAEEGEDDGGT